jgi:pyrrolidone-carboxylate peptidase/8-oxo-dGTP pyrophosphatase MutT (NUDIX family)
MDWAILTCCLKMTHGAEGMDEKPSPVGHAMAQALKVLVTGFEPFGNHVHNISAEVALLLAGPQTLADPWTGEELSLLCETTVLTVDVEGSMETSNRWTAGERWDAILHLGLCEQCDAPRVERLAKDVINMRLPDNAGRQLERQVIDGTGDRGCWVDPTFWNTDDFETTFSVSTDAGSYVCNETYFRTLSAVSSSPDAEPLPVPCLFVHLPDEGRLSCLEALAFVRQCLAYLVRPFPPQTVHVMAAHLARPDGLHVVTQRPTGDADAGSWEYAGGKCEPGEAWHETLQREVREELGLLVHPVRLLGSWLRRRDNNVYAIHLADCHWSWQTAEIKLTAHDDWQWADPASPPSWKWAGRDGEFYEHIRSLSHNQVEASPSSSMANSSLIDRGT